MTEVEAKEMLAALTKHCGEAVRPASEHCNRVAAGVRILTCAHPNIVESKRYPDGSIDGRCAECGEDGFPIRDVAYEEWMASGDAPRCAFGDPTLTIKPLRWDRRLSLWAGRKMRQARRIWEQARRAEEFDP